MRKILPLLLILSLTSCLSSKVIVNTPYTNGIAVDTLYLTSTMIGPVWQPVFPLIDAAAFNEKTNSISNEIMDEEEKILSSFQTTLVQSLQEKLPAVTLSGRDLHNDATKPYLVNGKLQVDNKNFPVVFLNEGDLNMIDLGSGKNIRAVFRENEETKRNIANFAHATELQNVLISYNRLAVVNVGMFGINGTIRLESYLFLYSRSGDLIIDVAGWTKPVSVVGNELQHYTQHFSGFRELTQMMATQLIPYVK